MSKFIPNAFQVPNAFVDSIMHGISGNAVKCYLLIVRKTAGWGKESDCISVSQFMDFCGIAKNDTAQKAIAELAEFGLIHAEKQAGKITRFYLNTLPEHFEEPHPKNGGTTTPENGVHPKNGYTQKMEEPHPKNGGTTTPENGVSTKDNTKNNNTKNNITRLDGTTTQNPPLDDSQDTAKKTKSGKAKNAAEKNLLAEFGITGVLADDYIAHRKIKRASIAETVLTTLKTKAAQCGMTLEQAMTLQIANGWTGFEVEWVMNRVGLTAKPQNNINNVPKHDNGGYQEW